MTTADPIAIETTGACRVLTLNRPSRRNALGTEGMRLLATALRDADASSEVKAIVLGAAPPAFCAGSDLKELGGLSVEAMGAHERETAAVARLLGEISRPVIAAVEGFALGGGCALAAACDLVVTGRGTRWAMPEVRNGWLPPWGHAPLLARLGPIRARTLVWGPGEIDGAEAFRIGLADRLVEDGQVLTAAVEWANDLAGLPLHAVASTKRFYAGFIADAVGFDDAANKVFQDDAAYPAAAAVLARFAVKRS